MTDGPILPWHRRHWAMLESAVERDQLHHALLIHGLRGLGKQRFAHRLAAALLCESAALVSQRPCGKCRGCRLQAAGSHPDRLTLAPEEGKSQISIEQVRALVSQNILTSHYGGYRVIVLNSAHSLSINAANALLKALEEPPEKHVFVLVSDRPSSLPVTLRSRCLSLLFSPPDSSQAKDWLARQSNLEVDWRFWLDWTGGAPLAALDAATQIDVNTIELRLKSIADLVHGRVNPVAIAQRWNKSGLGDNLNWQLRILAQLMRHQCVESPAESFPAISDIARKLNPQAMTRIYDEIMELRDAQMRNLHPNDRLALEGLAVIWQLASVSGPAPH